MPLLKLNTAAKASGEGNNPAPPTPASASSTGGPKLKLSVSQPSSAASQDVGARKKGNGGSAAKKGKNKRVAQDDISPNPKRPAANGPVRKFSIKVGAKSGTVGGDEQSPGLPMKRKSTVPKLRALVSKRPPPPSEFLGIICSRDYFF